MRSKKLCYGLLLALPIMFGLSLNVSSNTNALKYDVNTIPLYFPSYATRKPNFYIHTGALHITTSNDFDFSKINRQTVISFDDSDSDGDCDAIAYRSLPDTPNSHDGKVTLNYGFSGFSDPTFNPCLTLGQVSDIDTDSVTDLIDGSLPVATTFSKTLPYRFQYDGFYRTHIRTDSGLNYDNKFNFTDLYGLNNFPSTFYSMSIPLGSDNPDIISLYHDGQTVTFRGELLFAVDDYESPFGLTSSSSVELVTYDIQRAGYSGHRDTCSYDFLHKDSDELWTYSLSYTCSTTLDLSANDLFPWFVLEFYFDYSTSNTGIFGLVFDSSFVITDNDYTPGGNFNQPITGANPNSAPGSAYYDPLNPSGEANFLSSLTNLFNFNVINPFYPIYSLFTDNSNCASIPIIAGMLHSNETTICPWFDSQTRNIMTPVIGLASSMLLFGFIVRWLGSRSGNFVEDAGSIESPGTDLSGRHGWRLGGKK